MTKRITLITLLTIVLATPTIFAEDKCTPKPASKATRTIAKPIPGRPAPRATPKPTKTPDFTLSNLQFETLEEPYKDFQSLKIEGLTYIARLNLESDLYFKTQNKWRFSDMNNTLGYLQDYEAKILKTPTGMKLSSKQKEFITNGRYIIMTDTKSSIKPMYALGVDKEQAQKTAIAFLECLAQSAEKNYYAAEQELSRLEKECQKREKNINSYSDKTKAAKENFERIKQKTHYQMQTDALKAIERMNIIIETKTIELQVLAAKAEAIHMALINEENKRNAYLKGWADRGMSPPAEYNRQPIILKLEELRTDISIDLAEVRATVQATSKIRTDAELFIKYQDEHSDLLSTYNHLRDSKSRLHSALQSVKKMVANPPKSHLPPKVIDNKIILQPVKYIPPKAN